MERLIRSPYWSLAWVAASCLGIMLLILPRTPDFSCLLPLWLIVGGEWLFAFLFSIFIQSYKLRQSFSNLRIEPACYSLALIFFVTSIAIIFSPTAQMYANWAVSISLGQLIIMTLTIVMSIMFIERIYERDQDTVSLQKTTLARVANTRVKQPSMPKATGNKLGVFSKKSLPAVSPTPAPANSIVGLEAKIPNHAETPALPDMSQQEIPTATSQAQQSPRNSLPAEIRRLPPVNSAKKLSDIHKKSNSTMAKLQALSASGIGSLHGPTPLEEQELVTDASEISHPPENVPLVQAPIPVVQTTIPEMQLQPEAITATPTSVESKLFKEKVDDQVDQLFSGITPENAQRTVPDSLVNQASIVPAQPAAITPTSAANPVPAITAPVNATVPTANATSLPGAPSGTGEPKLFKEKVDTQVDQLFSGIASENAQRTVRDSLVNQASIAATPTPTPIPPAAISAGSSTPTAAAAPAAAEPKLFKEKVDDQVDQLFSGIAPENAQRKVSDSAAKQSEQDAAALEEQRAIAQELKDFGRLSIKGSATVQPSSPVGTMKTIGKLLIDSQDVDNIIKKAESGSITVNLPSAKVISAARGEGIQALLENIDTYQGITGSMLVGEDGLVIASTYKSGSNRDSTGVLAHGILGNSNLAMLRLDLGELEQMIMVSHIAAEATSARNVTTILTDLDVGALAVFADEELIVQLDQLLEQISAIARG